MKVTMYSTKFCPYCINAKALLRSKGIEFEDIPVDGKPALREEMELKSERYTVPQIWIDEQHIGGFDDLYALEQRQGLEIKNGSLLEEATELNE